MSEVTRLLQRVKEGDKAAEAEVVDLMYGEMRRMAAGLMRRERPDHTLGATELVHIGQAVLNLKGTVEYFVENTFNYPTLAEAYKIAGLDAWNRMGEIKLSAAKK